MTVLPGGEEDGKVLVPVECCLKGTSAHHLDKVRQDLIDSYLASLSSVMYMPTSLSIDVVEHPFLAEHVASLRLTDLPERPDLAGRPILAWDIEWQAGHSLELGVAVFK